MVKKRELLFFGGAISKARDETGNMFSFLTKSFIKLVPKCVRQIGANMYVQKVILAFVMFLFWHVNFVLV